MLKTKEKPLKFTFDDIGGKICKYCGIPNPSIGATKCVCGELLKKGPEILNQNQKFIRDAIAKRSRELR
ncbi:MAG: hypothetical protein V3T98_00170 [Candidatus Paceibacterota bacterium]